MAENKVEIKVTADTAQAVGGLGAVEKGLKGTGSSAVELGSNAVGAGKGLVQVGQAGETAAAGLGKTRQGVQSISQQLEVAKTQISAFIAAQLGLSTVKQVGQIADDYKNLEARIKLATGEGKAFQGAMDGVVGIAQRTNSNLETTGNLFAKITDAGKSAGLSTQAAISQSLRLTETINQAVQLSGASAGASSAAITQLIQGLQSGVLRGDEFNSVMEQAPRLSKAMADGLGVTTGELRKLAETGQLTADTVISALKSQSDTLKSEFATLPPTVGRALENLSTSWSVYIGEASKASGTSEAAAKAINALSNNLGTVAGYLIDAGQAVAGFTALKLAQTFLGIGAAATTAGTATAGNTAATVANTVAHQANATALAQNSITKQANVLVTSEQAAAKARAAGSTSMLTQATYVNTAGTTANTAAQVANALAVGNTGAAAAEASAGVGRFAALLGTLKLFSLIGIVTNFKDIGTAIGEGIAKLQGYKDRTEELARAEKLQAEIAAENQAMRERGQALTKAAIEKQFELSAAAKTSLADFEKLTKEGTSAAEAIAKIGKDFDLANVPGIKNAAAVLDKLLADGKLSATQFQKAWSDALKGADLAVFETQARAALAGTAREAERLAQVMDATLREAVKRTGLDFDVISGGMGKAARSAINDTEAIVKGLDTLKKQGVDTGQVLTASISKSINAADSQKAIDQVKAQIESLRAVLGNKLTDGLLDQAKEKAIALGDAADKAKPGINSLREAMAELGLKSREDLQKTAEKATQAYDTIKSAGQQEGESYVAWQRRKAEAFDAMNSKATGAAKDIANAFKDLGIQTQAELEATSQRMRQSFDLAESSGKASAQSLTQAFKKVLEAQIAAGGGFVSEMDAAKAAALGLEIAIDSTGKTIVKAFGDGEQAVDKYKKSLDDAKVSAEKLAEADAKRAETERNRLNVDKEGFTKDKNGGRLAMGSDIATLTGVSNFLKSAGLTEDQAKKTALEFSDGRGNIPFLDNPGQKKYGADTLSVALLKAAEQITFAKTSAAPFGSVQKPINAAPASAPSDAPAPAPAPAPTPAAQQLSSAPAAPPNTNNIYMVKLDFGTGQTRDINVASANDAKTLISALQQAKAAAGF